MSCIGNPSRWGNDIFPYRFIPKVLELLISTWAAMEKPDPGEHEVRITSKFVKRLQIQKRSSMLPFRIDDEYPEKDMNGIEICRIDITFNNDLIRQDVYFAIECKRLRIPYLKRINLNTGEYVGQNGMERFVSGKYAPNQPHAGMIAYVMDGKHTFAITSVREGIQKNKDRLCLIPGTCLKPCKIARRKDDTLISEHRIQNRKLTLYHLFFNI